MNFSLSLIIPSLAVLSLVDKLITLFFSCSVSKFWGIGPNLRRFPHKDANVKRKTEVPELTEWEETY